MSSAVSISAVIGEDDPAQMVGILLLDNTSSVWHRARRPTGTEQPDRRHGHRYLRGLGRTSGRFGGDGGGQAAAAPYRAGRGCMQNSGWPWSP